MEENNPHVLGNAPIGKLLLQYSIPAIIGMTLTSLYNIIDSIFIGHGVGALAISGLAITFPLMNLLIAFCTLVGVGGATISSIRLGQKDIKGAEDILGNVTILCIVNAIFYGGITLIFLDDILYFFGASESTLPYARDFMQIILGGTIVTHMYLSLNEVIRASGYPRRAMTIMLTAVVLNCLLNPLFIFGFGWGIRGSAAATVLAQVAALSVSLIHFSSRGSFIRFERGIFRLQASVVGKIFSIGMASFLLHLCASAVVIVVNKSLREYGGDVAIGAYGIIYRVAMLFLMIVSGLNQGMQPIVGYNYGARRYDRVLKVLRQTVVCAVCVTTTGFLLGQLFPRQVAMLFVDAADGAAAERMISTAAEGLRIVLCVFPIVGFQIVTSNFFQYIGKPHKAIFLSLTRQMLFLIPLLLVLPPHLGTLGVWMSMPIADGTASLLAAVLLFYQVRKFRHRPHAERSI